MGVSEILASVDREIALLRRVRALLSGKAAPAPKKNAPGHNGTAAQVIPAAAPPVGTTPKNKKKRKLSPEGRKRIAEAARRRWEAQRKAAAPK
jgi:L-lysine 2,3-aminomutase